MKVPVVFPQHLAVFCLYLARLIFQHALFFEKSGVIVGGDETDFLRIRLVKNAQALLFGNGAYFLLAVFAERQIKVRELFLREAVKHVRLVFGGVHALGHVIMARGFVLDHARVMAGGDIFNAHGQGTRPEKFEFDFFVAGNAGVGRSSGHVFAGEIIHHRGLEFFFHIEDVIRDAEFFRHAARVVHALHGTAGTGVQFVAILGRPGLDGGAGDVMPLFFQKIRGDGAVHAAAHGNENALFHERMASMLIFAAKTFLRLPNMRRSTSTSSSFGRTPKTGTPVKPATMRGLVFSASDKLDSGWPFRIMPLTCSPRFFAACTVRSVWLMVPRPVRATITTGRSNSFTWSATK